MKKILQAFRKILPFILFVTSVSQVFPVTIEEKMPLEEKMILVPKGAQPILKEEYPQGQLVVDRIKARHRYALSIPFSYAWNTAALTALTGLEEEPQVWDNREIGFALHSQRLRVGSLKNKEYFQKETAGFPEGRYWPMPLLEDVSQSKGYMATSFVHLVLKQVRGKYSDYTTLNDRISGILNAMIRNNKSLNMTAQRKENNYSLGNSDPQLMVRNNASISYNQSEEGIPKLGLLGESVWSNMTDTSQRDIKYISGAGSLEYTKKLSAGFDVDLKTKAQISSLRDETVRKNSYSLESRKSGWVGVSNIASPTSFLKLTLNASAVYDSKFKGYVTPWFEIALVPKVFQFRLGVRRQAILPDYDELYWTGKFIRLNEDLQPSDFWESYASMDIDIITRLRLHVEAYYSRPESRITWEQLDSYVWQPTNKPTSDSITGKGSVELNLVRSFNIFGNVEYQRFDKQYYDPEISANAGISYGNALVGSIVLGACFWNFQPMDISQPVENLYFGYIRINKSLFRLINIFIDGRYTPEREDVIYYRGMPQAGRIISLGANIVFGGID